MGPIINRRATNIHTYVIQIKWLEDLLLARLCIVKRDNGHSACPGITISARLKNIFNKERAISPVCNLQPNNILTSKIILLPYIWANHTFQLLKTNLTNLSVYSQAIL